MENSKKEDDIILVMGSQTRSAVLHLRSLGTDVLIAVRRQTQSPFSLLFK